MCRADITTDQRGEPRPNPVSALCDIGAYESAHPGSVDLVVSKTASPAEVAPGQAITYVLTFVNSGYITATGVVITEAVPASVVNRAVISSGVAITESGPGYTWQVQDLARGQGGAITLTGELTAVLAAGTIANTAGITCATLDRDVGNNVDGVQVTVLNVAPVAASAVETTTESAVLYGTLSAFDANGDVLSFGLLAEPITGSVDVDASGTYSYNPGEGWTGVDQFTYVVSDTGGLSGTATVEIHVTEYLVYLPMNLRSY